MNLTELLSQAYNKTTINYLEQWVGNKPENMIQIVALVFGKDYRLAQNASPVMSYVADKHPELIIPYIPRMIDYLEITENTGVKRNILRTLQFTPIPPEKEGQLLDTCFKLIENKKATIAEQCYSMTIIFNIAQHEPEILNELKLIVVDLLENASPGFKVRARQLFYT